MDKIAALHYECVMESFYDIDVSPANEANIGSIVKTIGEKVLAAIKFVIGRFKKLLQWIKSKAFRRKKVEKPAEKKQGEDRKEEKPEAAETPKESQKPARPEGYDTYMKRVEVTFNEMSTQNAKADNAMRGILREVESFVRSKYTENLDPDMSDFENAAEDAKEVGDRAVQLSGSLTAEYKAFLFYDDEATQKRLEHTLTNAMNVMINLSNQVNHFYDTLKASAVNIERRYDPFGKRQDSYVYNTDEEAGAHGKLQRLARSIIAVLQRIVAENNKCLTLLGRTFSVEWGNIE